jgi:glucose dehydrogenase
MRARFPMKTLGTILGFAGGLALAPGLGGQIPVRDAWPAVQHNSNYSPLTQITPANVARLRQAWTFNYGAGSLQTGAFVPLDYRFEIQPLIVGGVMYISTPGSPRDPGLQSTVTALEPETGKVIWQYRSPRRIHGRGLAYWPGTGAVGPRLYVATTQGYLVALNLRTGEPATSFGNRGELDVYSGVVSPGVGETRRDTYTLPNPVSVYRNLIITGARPGEVGPPQPRGDIRAFDATTGKLVWVFHTIPAPGEPNHETWIGDTWKDRSGANVWSTMTVDSERGLVFAPTGDANEPPPGLNLYANCLLALDANTGRLKWYHQLVHHDVFDMDLPTPPLLVDVKRGNRTIPAVLQTGKMNYVYIFDRVTGEPVYGMEERPVNRSDSPDDQAWPLQPFPLKPGPIGRLGMTRADINTLTPEIEKFCTDFWDSRKIQASGPYARPLRNAPIVTYPSNVGGANWGPLSYNPVAGLVFINVINTATYRPAGASAGGRGGDTAQSFAYRLPGGALASCQAPPYGELVAVDVNTGEIAWRVPFGLNESLAELGDLGLKTGTRNLGGSIATASGLVFIAATNDRRLRAFEATTGRELWAAQLPASGHATPVTYMGKDGAQYVVIAAGGGTAVGNGLPVSDALVAFKLEP